MRLFTLAVALLAAPAAFAQEAAPDTGQLAGNVRCSGDKAAEDLEYNIKRTALPDNTLGPLLADIAADDSRCAPLREAARARAATLAPAPPVSSEDRASIESRALIAQTLAEAESRAAQMKFEVGPPPRNMTRGRDENP